MFSNCVIPRQRRCVKCRWDILRFAWSKTCFVILWQQHYRYSRCGYKFNQFFEFKFLVLYCFKWTDSAQSKVNHRICYQTNEPLHLLANPWPLINGCLAFESIWNSSMHICLTVIYICCIFIIHSIHHYCQNNVFMKVCLLAYLCCDIGESYWGGNGMWLRKGLYSMVLGGY